MGLELYGRIEELLGFEEETERLYDLYIEILRSWRPRSLLDVGCGSGRFLQKAKEALSLQKAYGVDLSVEMVRRAKKRGVQAEAVDVCKVPECFEAATAIFDVLNYLSPNELPRFLACVEDRLETGGVFLADVNTLTGFDEVAQGALVRSVDDRLLALESVFDGKRLETTIDYFEKAEEGRYIRQRDRVVQYYHDPIDLAKGCEGLELVQSYPVALYADAPDKEILLFRKQGTSASSNPLTTIG